MTWPGGSTWCRTVTETVVLGIAGGTGSGKSTVVRKVRRLVGPGRVSVLHHDAYYLDRSDLERGVRDQVNFDHPNSLDTTLMREHVDMLLAGNEVGAPVYDFTTHSRTEGSARVRPRPLLILDGILILADERLRDVMNLKVFVDTPSDVRLIRRIRRDTRDRGRTTASVIEQYEKTVRPMHEEFVEPSRRHADLIVTEGGHNRVAMDLLLRRIEALVGPTLPPPPVLQS